MIGRSSQEKEEREKERVEKQEREQEARAKKEEEEEMKAKAQQEVEEKQLEVSGRNATQKNRRQLRRQQSRATKFQRNIQHFHSPRLAKNSLHSLHPKVVYVESRHEKVFLWNPWVTGKLARWRRNQVKI